MTKRQLTILLVLASFFLFACNFFFPENDPSTSKTYEDNEYAEEEGYDEYLTEIAKEDPSNDTPVLSIESIPEGAHPAFDVFEQYINIFGVSIYASADISAEKFLHAAGVMAQYLDNNEDGQADDPAIIQALNAKDATLFMFSRPDSRDEQNFIDGIEKLLDNDELSLQPLYGEETVPNGAARGEFDASLEEILHLITNTGYAHAYPDIFGEERGSAIASAMDEARGGYFKNVPNSYPEGAWYTYDDETCDYACMISEYHYWALTSLLGAQDFSGRGDEIDHEWKLNTPEKLRDGDPNTYALLTDPHYHNPTVLPDGNYSP